MATPDDPTAPGLHLTATETSVTISWSPAPELTTPALSQHRDNQFAGLREAMRSDITEILTVAALHVMHDPATDTLTITPTDPQDSSRQPQPAQGL